MQAVNGNQGERGVCPLCDGLLDIGTPCAERVCSRQGMHAIPASARAKLPERPDELIGSLIGDYLLVGVVGAGGFGKVYLALQLPILMPAALKLMRLEAHEPARAAMLISKFEGEARALARLAHPNIVRLLKYGHFQNMPYLVMEFVDGARSLKDEVGKRAAAKRGFEIAEVSEILRQVLDGLEAAHDQQIIHRDIKPENIMLQSVAGNANFVRLLDFGLAKFVSESEENSVAMGTPTYMAPEQMSRRNIGPWTDLYAVTVMAVELMFGRKPFPGNTTEQVLASKLDPNYDPARVLAEFALPDFVTDFVRKGLAILPESRFRSVPEWRASWLEIVRAADEDKLARAKDATALLDIDRAPVVQAAPVTRAVPADPVQTQATELRTKVFSPPFVKTARPEALTATATLAPTPASRRTLFVGAALFLVAALGVAAWLSMRNDAAPQEASRPVIAGVGALSVVQEEVKAVAAPAAVPQAAANVLIAPDVSAAPKVVAAADPKAEPAPTVASPEPVARAPVEEAPAVKAMPPAIPLHVPPSAADQAPAKAADKPAGKQSKKATENAVAVADAPKTLQNHAAPAIVGQKTGTELYLEANAEMNSGDKASAVAKYEKAIALGNVKAHGKLAKYYFEVGDKKKCTKHLNLLLKGDPSLADKVQGLLEHCAE